MTTIQINHVETFVTEECITCGITFAVTSGYQYQRKQDHVCYFCPNGHQQAWTGKTEAQIEKEKGIRLQQQLDQERAAAARLKAERESLDRRLRAAKGQQTKLRKRIAAGTCPECDQSFADLASHMQHDHPEFQPEDVETPDPAEVSFADYI